MSFKTLLSQPFKLATSFTMQETEEDMRRSIFCVCPPGNTQDSARVWRSIIFGCIPVTFFR